MTKFDFFMFRVNLFAVSQSYNLQSSWFTINSNDLRFLSPYKMFVSSANRKNLRCLHRVLRARAPMMRALVMCVR